MLPKKERLSREEFNRFFSVAKRYHTPSLQILHAPYQRLHVSVVVSKKVAKKAVVRNKIRRRIYDSVRRYRTEESLTGVFIIMAKAGAVLKKHSILASEIQAGIKSILK